jgi:hypothetical protein
MKTVEIVENLAGMEIAGNAGINLVPCQVADQSQRPGRWIH